MRRLLGATAAALLMSTAAANATTISVTLSNVSISEQYSSSRGGPTITNVLSTPYTTNVSTGSETTAQNFFTATPAGSCSGSGCVGGSYGTETDTLTASFTFTEPSATTPTTVSETATFSAKYSGSELSCSTSGPGESDCIVWSASPLQVNFNDGAVLDVYLNNAQDWSITPTIQLKLVDGPDTPAPEPASLALLGTALVGLGLIRRRRKSA